MATFKSRIFILFLIVFVQVECKKRTKSLQTHPKISLRAPEIDSTALNVNPHIVNCNTKSFRDAVKTAKSKAKCRPRPTVIHLESSSHGTLVPNAVIVNKCLGLCMASHKCIATNSTFTTHYVRAIKNNHILCTSVNIQEDLACKCDCPERSADCNMEIQEYDRDNCKCVCKKPRQCNKPNFSWKEKSCECVCKKRVSCTTGTNWNDKECNCSRNNEFLTNYVT